MLVVAELIRFADAEVAVFSELNGSLAAAGESGVTAGTIIPKPRPPKFIRIIVTGGTERDFLTDSPVIVVECFATLESHAANLAATARAILSRAGRNGILGGVTCYGVTSVGRPVNLPMESVPDRFRYTFTISADLRGSAV